jgi:DNA mismatch repair protein MutS
MHPVMLHFPIVFMLLYGAFILFTPNKYNDGTPAANGDLLQSNIKKLSTPQMQLSIFDAHSETFDEIRKMLENIDINRLTPVEALMKLNEVKKMIK